MMSRTFDYTAIAQRVSARFPVLSYVMIQINFWIMANIFLGILMHLQALSIGAAFKLERLSRLGPIIFLAVILGVLYGICLGLTDNFLDRNIFKKQPLGRIILLKTSISFLVLTGLVALIRFVFFNAIIATPSYKMDFTMNGRSWEYFFYVLLLYYFVMTLVINFINQVNKKYGPGILIPLLLGKYRNPREEERIFLFMDLKSSTSIAEKLGHLQYSAFIRDSFSDINQVLAAFNVQVYQYVGDEIVVMWNVRDGLKDFACIRFFFACEKQFYHRGQYYAEQYGFLPQFKAGAHMGVVTAVEIGDVKRDIAYHGDTLNTAARIQGVCNYYGKKFLVSDFLLQQVDPAHELVTTDLGLIQLRGKITKVDIWSVEDF
ncbi:adenylate/guanylate cyclase domain-containing protein [Deminuibacter soli]|nr:adenylate/guanylate cyclase domain-containing protein [Deminuibacter soli]